MKYELLNQDLQDSVAQIKLNIQKHHLDLIDGVPDHCLEIAIANYLYFVDDFRGSWKLGSIASI